MKPGCEADLDTLIQDNIRLTTSVNVLYYSTCPPKQSTLDLFVSNILLLNFKLNNYTICAMCLQETCSDFCEKSELGLNSKY